MSFSKKYGQSLARITAEMTPVIKALYKEAADAYINLHKRGTALFKAFCHNAVNVCLNLSAKSFAMIALVPAGLLLATVDVSSRAEKNAQQMKTAIAAQLQNTRPNTQTSHAGIDMQNTQAGMANALAADLAGAARIAPPVLSSDALLTLRQESGARDAVAYLEEGLKAAQVEPAAGP
jgi:hypothetical protein